GLWILGERNFNVSTPLISKFNFYDRVFLRPYATFSHPNLLSGFLLAALPLLSAGLSSSLHRFKTILGLLVSSTIFITFSRPGVVIAGVYAAVFFRKNWKLLLIMTVVIAPLAFVRFSSIFTFDSLAVLRREELSEFALKLFLESPVTGIGLNNFINALAASEVLVGTSRFLQPVHNIFLLILSETGILGLSGFLGILGSAFWVNLKKKDSFSKALLTSLMTIVFLGMFDHYFLTLPQGQRIFFMVIGLSLRNLKHRT
ncbi:O-antigen ligase family protein, partial [Candidatus Daviesbacteria bacterium]|nr:O-antigen ligase family protein [Candidatus Daviesbacteria bacterium]